MLDNLKNNDIDISIVNDNDFIHTFDIQQDIWYRFGATKSDYTYCMQKQHGSVISLWKNYIILSEGRSNSDKRYSILIRFWNLKTRIKLQWLRYKLKLRFDNKILLENSIKDSQDIDKSIGLLIGVAGEKKERKK
jgi:hypothetical protein